MLEEAGMKGNVLLIDGAPVFLKQLSYGHITSNVTDESIQLMLIISIVQNMFPEESPEEIMLKLAECPTWDQKIDKLIEFGRSQTEYSEKYMRSMAHALFNRLKIVFNYDTKNVKKIKSAITLVRPTEVAVVDIDEDYELSRFTSPRDPFISSLSMAITRRCWTTWIWRMSSTIAIRITSRIAALLRTSSRARIRKYWICFVIDL